MDGFGTPPPAAAATSAVLDDDDLLGEILLRVAFPTSLVHAALVCKRWLGLASDPVFLHRFRDLHPPRLLGFYVRTTGRKPPQFVPVPQPPELAAVGRSPNIDLGTLGSDSPPRSLYVDCWNDLLLLTSFMDTNEPKRIVRCPLYPARYTTILPPVPDSSFHDGFTYDEGEIILDGGGDGLSSFYLALASKGQQTAVHVEITGISLQFPSLIGDGKVYNLASVGKIDKLFVLDLASSSLSLVNLPEEALPWRGRLSLADHSGVHLINVKDLEIRIWLHKMDSNGVPNWFLANTICLREIFGNHMIPIHMLVDVDDYYLAVHAVGFNAEFLFIEIDDVLYLVDIKCKVLKKVYEMTQEDTYFYTVSPFMMVSPPKFPVMKEGCDLKE
uniref:F-box domain-containing protein n=1 Tax=Aegilops tauschii TaxID=37682 RepID=N1QVA0_AEGTA